MYGHSAPIVAPRAEYKHEQHAHWIRCRSTAIGMLVLFFESLSCMRITPKFQRFQRARADGWIGNYGHNNLLTNLLLACGITTEGKMLTTLFSQNSKGIQASLCEFIGITRDCARLLMRTVGVVCQLTSALPLANRTSRISITQPENWRAKKSRQARIN